MPFERNERKGLVREPRDRYQKFYYLEKRFIAEATQQLSFPAPRQAALLMRINPDTMPGSDVADVGSGITIHHGESIIILPAGSSAEDVANLVKALNRHD